MTDTPPDRLSIDPDSPHFNETALEKPIVVCFKGTDRRDVVEYCASEGWIRVQAGKTLDRKGKPLTIKLTGTVEPRYEEAQS
jgi:hypothetical protein